MNKEYYVITWITMLVLLLPGRFNEALTEIDPRHKSLFCIQIHM